MSDQVKGDGENTATDSSKSSDEAIDFVGGSDGFNGPSWKNPAAIDILLMSPDDDCERVLAQTMVQLGQKAVAAFSTVAACEYTDDAKRALKVARDLAKTLCRCVTNLVQHNYKGMQTVTVLHGPRVGLEAKVRELQIPKLPGPHMLAIEWVEDAERKMQAVADHFSSMAQTVRYRLSDREIMRQARYMGIEIPTEGVALDWDALAAKALDLVVDLQEKRSQLIYRRRGQVVVAKHEGIVKTDRSTEYPDGRGNPSRNIN